MSRDLTKGEQPQPFRTVTAVPAATLHPSHEWGEPLPGSGHMRCRNCGAYSHLGSGFLPCMGKLQNQPVVAAIADLRDRLARDAMKLLLDDYTCSNPEGAKAIAESAYLMADAMLAARNPKAAAPASAAPNGLPATDAAPPAADDSGVDLGRIDP